ncbi:MAG: ABC transporter permease [Synergistaceae bacterium]|nr:ABC transporter permease [Synergistaceae bacterium]
MDAGTASEKILRDGGVERHFMSSFRSLAVYIGKKLLVFFFMMFLLSTIVFYVSRLTPGDPLEAFYGGATQSMTSEELDAARARLGLDGSITRQYAKWLGNVFRGDFGISLRHKRPVLDVVRPLVGNTLVLGGTAYVLVFSLATGLALFCARFEDSFADRAICKAGTAAYYIPAFWLGTVLVLLFSVNLRLLPSSGAYDIGKSGDIPNRIRHMILPLIVMVASHLWYYAYMIRNKLLDEVRRDYVLLARSKGLGKTRILFVHCLRNVFPTIVNIMAISIPHVLSGTYIAESVFNYPGIGSLAVSSAKYHDYNLLMLMVLITGVLVTVSSLAGQMINERIDPRMKARRETD